MVVRPATLLLLAALSAAAAAAGGWLAVRQNLTVAAPENVSAAARVDPGRLGPSAVAAAEPAAQPAPVALPTAAAAVPDPVAAASREPDPPVAREPRVRTAHATARTAPPDRPAPAEANLTAPDAHAAPVAAAPAAVPETDSIVAETAPEPAPEADAPPPIPSPDVAWRSAASALPRVDGWVPAAESTDRVDPEPPPIDQLVVGADSVIGLQMETTVSSAAAQVEDDVDARVTRDVMVGDRVAIPAGTQVLGSVVLVEQAGKLRGNPRLGVRFHAAIMDDGAELPISTETVYRDGPGLGSESTRRIGGAAVGGAILGAIFGGRRGAAIGSAAGAAGGTAMAVAHDGPPASFPAGARVTIRLLNPATVRVDRLRPGRR